jgi:hypothetical protein
VFVNDAQIRLARTVDPRPMLAGCGFTVERDGQRHYSVKLDGIEVYRLTDLGERWVYCHHSTRVGGNVIALARELDPMLSFPEAVTSLLEGEGVAARAEAPVRPASPKPEREARPQLPARASLGVTIDYLGGRHIPRELVFEASRQGFVYPLNDGVAFIGRDSGGAPRSVTKRSADPAAEVTKRDFRGSDKKFAPILRGDPANVWIAEGGVDALALHALAELDGQPPPAVIVSGGARNKAFLDGKSMPETVREVLAAASRVTVAGEREKDAATQAAMDGARADQAVLAGRAAPHAEVIMWFPPEGQGKDVADVLDFRMRKDHPGSGS